jgi:MFS family permease
VLLAAGVLGMPLSQNLWMLAITVALIPLGTAFTFPCVTALLSRVISQRERGLYMGMQQTYGGVARIIAPLFFGWSFDRLGVRSPYFFSAAFIMATVFLGFGLDQYARPKAPVTPEPEPVSGDGEPEGSADYADSTDSKSIQATGSRASASKIISS